MTYRRLVRRRASLEALRPHRIPCATAVLLVRLGGLAHRRGPVVLVVLPGASSGKLEDLLLLLRALLKTIFRGVKLQFVAGRSTM